MFDHVEIKVVDIQACTLFYTEVLKPLGVTCKWSDEVAAGFGPETENKTRFLIEQSKKKTTVHIAFSATDAASVDQFHSAGIQAGYRCNGAPGLRIDYAPGYYAAFLLDPDGNNIEAVTYL